MLDNSVEGFVLKILIYVRNNAICLFLWVQKYISMFSLATETELYECFPNLLFLFQYNSENIFTIVFLYSQPLGINWKKKYNILTLSMNIKIRITNKGFDHPRPIHKVEILEKKLHLQSNCFDIYVHNGPHNAIQGPTKLVGNVMYSCQKDPITTKIFGFFSAKLVFGSLLLSYYYLDLFHHFLSGFQSSLELNQVFLITLPNFSPQTIMKHKTHKAAFKLEVICFFL